MARFVRTQTIRHPIGAAGTFRLGIVDGDVVLRGSDDDEAAVTASFTIRADADDEADRIFEAVRFTVREGDGSLDVEEPTGRGGIGELVGRLFGAAGADADVDVQAVVPRGAAVRVNGVSADVQAEGLSGRQAYRTVSGDVRLSDVGGELSVDGVSADLTVRGTGRIRLECHSVSGDLELAAPIIESLRAISVSGDIRVEGRLLGDEHRAETVSGDLGLAPIGGVTVEVRGMSSEVRSDLEHRLEGSLGRRRIVVGDGAARLQFSTMSGDVAIVRPRRLDPDQAMEVMQVDQHPRPVEGREDDVRDGSGDERWATRVPAGSAAAGSRLEILRALERGELDVEEAMQRLEGASDE